MKSKFTMYSNMEWLDEVIARSGVYNDYYKTLKEIKKAQKDGSITDELYSRLCSTCGLSSSERGYYNSNIHYDLFYNYDSLERIESRMLHFLDNADQAVLRNDKFFELNLINELRYFMSERYNIPNSGSNSSYFEKYGNDVEKEIFNKIKLILKLPN